MCGILSIGKPLYKAYSLGRGKQMTIKDVLHCKDNDMTQKVIVAVEDDDGMTYHIWEGQLQDIPTELHNLEATAGYLMGADCFELTANKDDLVRAIAAKHKEVFDSWDYGTIKEADFFADYILVTYSNGTKFHYSYQKPYTNHNELVWW